MAESSWAVGVIGAVGAGVTTCVAIGPANLSLSRTVRCSAGTAEISSKNCRACASAAATSAGDGKVTAGASCWVAGAANGASAATGSAAGSGATGVGSGASPSTSWTVRTTSSMPTCDLTR